MARKGELPFSTKYLRLANDQSTSGSRVRQHLHLRERGFGEESIQYFHIGVFRGCLKIVRREISAYQFAIDLGILSSILIAELVRQAIISDLHPFRQWNNQIEINKT